MAKYCPQGISRNFKDTYSGGVTPVAAAEDGTNATVNARGVEITFYKDGKKVKILRRGKNTQINDPSQLDISNETKRAAYAMAAAIMKTNFEKFQRRKIITPGPDYR